MTTAPATPPVFNLHAAPPTQARNFADGGLVPSEGALPAGSPAGLPQQPAAQVPQEDLQAELDRFMSNNPEVVRKVQEALQAAIEEGAVTPQDLQLAVQMALAAAQDPAMYPQLRQMATQRGLATEEDLPQEYDQGIVFALLIAGAAMSGQQGGASQQLPQQNSPQGS